MTAAENRRRLALARATRTPRGRGQGFKMWPARVLDATEPTSHGYMIEAEANRRMGRLTLSETLTDHTPSRARRRARTAARPRAFT